MITGAEAAILMPTGAEHAAFAPTGAEHAGAHGFTGAGALTQGDGDVEEDEYDPDAIDESGGQWGSGASSSF